MFQFKRPKVINKLTQKINKDANTTVKEVLSNEDLSPSIRNEVPELLDFFCPPLPSPPSVERSETSVESYKVKEEHQKELALLAFTSKLNREGEPYSDDLVFRFNRNATNIISSPSKKFHDRLIYYYTDGKGKNTPSPFLEQLLKFTRSMKKDKNVHHQPVFYGHFHRIFESIVRSSKGQIFEILYKLDSDLDPLYEVFLNGINLSSIRSLYVTCTSEYPQQFSGSNANDQSIVFIELAKFGANHSTKIRGKKGKVLKKIIMKKNDFQDFQNKKKDKNDYSKGTFDELGFHKNVKYLSKDEAKKHQGLKKKTENSQIELGKTTKKVTRLYHYQFVVATLFAMRDILSDSTEIVQYFRKDQIIESLLKMGKNAPESSFVISLSYNLILKILVEEGKGIIDDFDQIINRKEFLPDYSKIKDLKNRIETIECANEYECSGEHLIYQLPLYFLKLPNDFQNLFFSDKKYSSKLDEQYVFAIKNVLTKDKQKLFFQRDDNLFLKNLCKAMPEPPELDLTNFSMNDQSIDPELPSVQVNDGIVDNDFKPKPRQPLQSFLWDIAKYIDDDKNFKNDEIPFKEEQEWSLLHEKIVKYYKNVFAYVSNPEDEEEEDLSN